MLVNNYSLDDTSEDPTYRTTDENESEMIYKSIIINKTEEKLTGSV